jgi:hypothetical protein
MHPARKRQGNCGPATRELRAGKKCCLEKMPMFGRLGRFMRRILGNLLYWVGCLLAVFIIIQAIVLAIAVGNPFIPLLIGAAGVLVWLIAIGFKYVLAGAKAKAR